MKQQHTRPHKSSALTGVSLSTTDLPTSTQLVTHMHCFVHASGREHQTFVQAYAIGVVLTFYDQVIVLQALVLTLSVVAGLSAFTFQTKRDFSFLGYGLFGGLMLLMVAGIMQLFLGSSVLELVISLAGAFLFAIFIVYDTQMLMKTLSPEEYILATINLYLDIVNLFLYILRALEAVRRQ
uniref:Uncharacterized protein n=1 Tax=Timema tahoe TaxID=61484 RepID=A0A7R9NYX0_9NEOP|nr:unnamed protein product [Timema tahoe]